MEYVEIPDSVGIREDELTADKARDALSAVKDLDHVTYIGCYRDNNEIEYIVFDAKIQLPQVVTNDIRYDERVAVGFYPQDDKVPEVFALRADFPANLPHTNLRKFQSPKSLCLYDTPYEEVKLLYTGKSMVERIRSWLRSAALGTLHQDNQYLEPFLFDHEGLVILPIQLWTGSYLSVKQIGEIKGKPILKAAADGSGEYVFLPLPAKPRQQAAPRFTPTNFRDLFSFGRDFQIDIAGQIAGAMGILMRNAPNKKVIIGVVLPRTKGVESENPEFETHFFISDTKVSEFNELLRNADTDWSMVACECYNMAPDMCPEIAAKCNGLDIKKSQPKILAIGMGALGSQIFDNLSRQAYGKWNLIDDDAILPHNLARHSLSGEHIGKSKSASLSEKANLLLNDKNFSEAYVLNVLEHKDQAAFRKLASNVDIIFDFSASVAVARHLVETVPKKHRIISCFMNPTGTDLAIISEGTLHHSLDYLEMAYYRYLLENPELHGHLRRNTRQKYYAKSCRDRSFEIIQDYFSIHAGIASGHLKDAVESANPQINIWSIAEDYSVQRYSVPTAKVHLIKSRGWEIYYDDIFLQKLRTLWEERLPNETGGLLIGNHDMSRNKLYLADVIGSPDDSEEYPHSYKRGMKGIEQKLGHIDQVTAGQLRYVGEWHSHPRGCSTRPSDDDKLNFEWIRQAFSNDGLPPVSLIQGDDRHPAIYIDVMA